MTKLFQNLIFSRLFCCFLVKLKNVDHSLWVLSSFLFGDSALADESLPFLWQALYHVSNETWDDEENKSGSVQ